MLVHTSVEKGRIITRPEPNCVLTRDYAAQYLGISLRTLERLVKSGDGPSPIKLSQNRYGFRQTDLDKYLEDRTIT